MKPQFTLQTLLLLFVVVASALAAFEAWGLLVSAVIFAVAAYIRTHASPGRGARNVFLLLCFGTCFLCLLSPSVSHVRETHRRADCQNRMKQLVLALHNYHDTHGHFPPAYVLGPDGKPWHSWRTLILPCLEQKPLYDMYRFDEPWDGPNNRKLASRHLGCFVCSSDTSSTTAKTNYVAVVGPPTMWPGEKHTSLSDGRDKSGQTILLVEVKGADIGWAEPRDLTFAEACQGVDSEEAHGISAHHIAQDYFHVREPLTGVGLVDGNSRCLAASTSPDTWRALLTRAGGEDVDTDWDRVTQRLNWEHIGGLISLLLSTLLLIFRPIPRGDDPAKWRCPGEEEEEEHAEA